MLRRLRSYLSTDVPVADLEPLRARCDGATDLVDTLPDGPDRSAGWAAYALQTYADKLLAGCGGDGYIDAQTAGVVRASYTLAAVCLDVARGGAGDIPRRLPHWRTPVRSHEQLVGMRDTLESLRTYLAYAVSEGVPEVDAQLAKVERLWIERAPPEIRGGIGDALVNGLDLAYETGRLRFTS